MSHEHLHLTGIAYRYDSSPEPIFEGLSLTLPAGWTGVVGANGVGKTTLLRLAVGLLTPSDGSVSRPGAAVYVEQRTDAPPDRLPEFLWTWEGDAPRLRERLSIGLDYAERWNTLSHGERKRAQIAVALWLEPEVLALDEPTNHLDRDARELLGSVLAGFRGIGLVVSHDRALLDRLCAQCVFLRQTGAVVRPGGVSDGLREEEREIEHQRHEYGAARAELTRLKKEADRRSRAAAVADKKKSKRFINPKDTAAKTQMDGNRVLGKDAIAGKLLRQLDGRLRHAESRMEDRPPPPKRKLGVTMAGETARADTLFMSEPGVLPLGDGAGGLAYPRLCIEPTDRIALIGPNGGGKSTLIRTIAGSVGSATTLYLPQEISVDEATALIDRIRTLPNDELGRILSGVSRLGSDPEALLSTELPSPGETRKLLIAEGLAGTPTLIVLDEPTNHMDLPSIRCLEEALAETACALLLVSHDMAFLDRLVGVRWVVRRTDRSKRTDSASFELSID